MHKLQNNHNVYILGAGFSVDRGLPTIKDFMLSMRDAHEWLEASGRKEEAKAIAKVLEFRLEAASAAYRVKLELENIEELFSLASASDRALTTYIQLAIASTLDFKLQTNSEPKINFQFSNYNADKIPSHWSPVEGSGDKDKLVECPAYEFYLKTLLGDWNGQIKHNSNTFISFNYDLLIENSLEKLKVPYWYGIDAHQKTSSNAVELLKLHGSINWGADESNKQYKIHDSYHDLINENHFPQLVPPTWRKLFTGELRKVWDKSIQSLVGATRIIVIGFSIPPTDNHFKYLMAAGLQKNISLREIIFVNPDKMYLEQRAKDIFGDAQIVGHASATSPQVKIIGCSMSSFLSQGLGNINSYGRQIPKDIQNIQIYH